MILSPVEICNGPMRLVACILSIYFHPVIFVHYAHTFHSLYHVTLRRISCTYIANESQLTRPNSGHAVLANSPVDIAWGSICRAPPEGMEMAGK